MAKDVFDEMGQKWDAAGVARTVVDRFSGGILNSKTMANLDSQGIGPTRIQIGRKVLYPLSGENGLISWMRARSNQ